MDRRYKEWPRSWPQKILQDIGNYSLTQFELLLHRFDRIWHHKARTRNLSRNILHRKYTDKDFIFFFEIFKSKVCKEIHLYLE